jgi:hypothetical protein
MDNLTYLKASVWVVLALAILCAIGFIIYEMRKAGSSISNVVHGIHDYVFGPTVVTPKNLQKFIDEPSNQPGGFVPWTPTIEEDTDTNPSWLVKGAL